jgi:hypothetical protein
VIGEPLRGDDNRVTSLAFSPDGKTLASGSYDKTIRLWDTSTWRAIGEPLRGHDDSVTSIAFSPDGKTLVSGSYDEMIRLWSGVPLREQYPPYCERMNQVARVRSQLVDRIAAVDNSVAAVEAFADEVRADPRFTGDLRTASLIVIGELDLARQAEAERLRLEIEALSQRDWSLYLRWLATAAPTDSWWDATYWNEVAWAGLTELPAGAPGRDLNLLLVYAERAVRLSRRDYGSVPSYISKLGNALDTLARAHWELGDKGKALEVQREAVTVSAAALETKGEDQTKAAHAEIEATLKLYESLPAGAALPKEATPDTPAPTPIP